jgi:glutathione S-transferase
MTDLVLYGSLELGRSWWVAWMCRELEIPFRNERTERFTDAVLKTEEYTSLNPNGRVPSIKDGEFVLWESMAINLYLAKKYGRGRVCPDDPEGEALSAQWSFWAVTRVEVPLLLVMISNRSEMTAYYLQRIPMWSAEEVARCRAVLNAPLTILDAKLGSSNYLLGSDFSVADLKWLAFCRGIPVRRSAFATSRIWRIGCALVGRARPARAKPRSPKPMRNLPKAFGDARLGVQQGENDRNNAASWLHSAMPGADSSSIAQTIR